MTRLLLIILGFTFFLALFSFPTEGIAKVRVKVTTPQVKKEDVLKKYERVIVRSNQMNMYGYDLHDVAFKLRRLTEVLIANQFEQADKMLDEIGDDLKAIEAKGPEHLRRERRLVWLEIFGDFIQQVAIFIVIAIFLLRFRFVKSALAGFGVPNQMIWKLTLLFSVTSIFAAMVGFLRFGQSSWSFIDLQVLFIGLGGLVGGVWVGIVTGLVNSAVRFVIVPMLNPYLAAPIVVGVVSGLFRSFRKVQALNRRDVLSAGFGVGLLHSLFMYVPIYSYLPLRSFFDAILFLTAAECIIVYLFFVLAWGIFKEEKRKETERELFRTRLQFLQAQINPHFLFNTLNTIAAVCGEERAERARQLIVQLSTFFRRITKQEGDLVSLEDELEYIDAYLDMERARFGERLQIEKDVQLSASGYGALVPILVLQPIVENAIKHGLAKKAQGGKIVIRIAELNSRIQIEVGDNGIGMNEQIREKIFSDAGGRVEENGLEHTGIGLKNIRERMIKLFGNQFEMAVASAPDQGTTVSIAFPKSL